MKCKVYKIKLNGYPLGLLDRNDKERFELRENDDIYLFKRISAGEYSVLIKLDENVWVVTKMCEEWIVSMMSEEIDFPDNFIPEKITSFTKLQKTIVNKRPIKI